jgi:hypothetical protein
MRKAHSITLLSIFRTTLCTGNVINPGLIQNSDERTFSSPHVQRANGSKRCWFSYSAGGRYASRVLGLSKTEGWVAIASGCRSLALWKMPRIPAYWSTGVPNSGISSLNLSDVESELESDRCFRSTKTVDMTRDKESRFQAVVYVHIYTAPTATHPCSEWRNGRRGEQAVDANLAQDCRVCACRARSRNRHRCV